MNVCQGHTYNLKKPVLCKVVCNTNSSGKNRALLCQSGWPKETGLFEALIVDPKVPPNKSISIPVFQMNGNSLRLEDGDIVLIESSQLTLLYRKGWISNSVMPTEKCNCRCIMCPQPPREDAEDLVDFSLRTISLMDPDTQAIGITGGEPTLVWDGLIEILTACEKHIPSASVQLLSNGRVLKDFAKAEELAEVGGPELFVGIPLYGDVHEIHDTMVRARGAFWDTLEGIYNLGRLGVFIELRIVITKYNYLRLPQWAEYVYRTMPFIGHIALMGLEPVGLAVRNIEKLWVDPADYAQQLENAVKILRRRDMRVSVFNHQLCTLPESVWPYCVRSISEWKTVYMSECESCHRKATCGGFFYSADVRKSKAIHSLQ